MALQLFEQCWMPPILDTQKKQLNCQTSLGKLHDCDVWIKILARWPTSESANLDTDESSKRVVGWALSFREVHGKYLSAGLMQ